MRLQNVQELGLHLGRNLADLIEEDGAPVGELEPADSLGDGACEGPFFVTEELTFDEAGRQRAAVDLDEGLLGALAGGVDGAARRAPSPCRSHQ